MFKRKFQINARFFFYGKRRVSRGRLFVAKPFFSSLVKSKQQKNIAEWNNNLKILCAVFFPVIEILIKGKTIGDIPDLKCFE